MLHKTNDVLPNVRDDLMKIFFWIQGNLISWKTYFVGSGEWVKPRLSQALKKDARPDSNSRLAVQISSLLLSRHASWDPLNEEANMKTLLTVK
jgi:hypothetical protein